MILDNEDTQFSVVVNDQLQYSIWPQGLPIPAGWSSADMSGTKQECLAYVETVWTDMRPVSLRRAMGTG